LALADVFRRVRTGDSIVSGPVMLIGSYRSFPCVAPKAVHRAYAKRALMNIPSLEDYERKAAGAAMEKAS
jgi:hypothetical protein